VWPFLVVAYGADATIQVRERGMMIAQPDITAHLLIAGETWETSQEIATVTLRQVPSAGDTFTYRRNAPGEESRMYTVIGRAWHVTADDEVTLQQAFLLLKEAE
jgi:hypothetical protein